MLIYTISVFEKVISTVSKKLNKSPVIECDLRSNHSNRPHVISSTVIDLIKEHIAMFPMVELYYKQLLKRFSKNVIYQFSMYLQNHA